MSEVTKPIALDETFNTTESTPRNLADVLAEGLGDIANNVKPDASDIPLDPITGMSATNVQSGISELKGTLDGKLNFTDVSSGDFNNIKTTGLYYLRNAVTNKPISQNGLFLVANVSGTDTRVGVFVPNLTSGGIYICTWRAGSNTWVHYNIN